MPSSSCMLFFILASFTVHCTANERWSRQLTAETGGGDWIPLEPQPLLDNRQASSRVLNQPAPFHSSFFPVESSPNDYMPQESPRSLYLQTLPNGQQTYQHNSLNQPVVQLTLTDPQYNPLAQGFVASPFNNLRQNAQLDQFQQSALPAQIIQHPTHINNQFYSQSSNLQPQGLDTQISKAQKQTIPKYVDGYKVDNISADYFPTAGKKKPQKIKAETNIKTQSSVHQKVTERSSTISAPMPTAPVTTVEKEEVQLLYVPLETLQKERFDPKQYFKSSPKHDALRDSIGSPGQINNQLYASTTPNYSQRQQTQLHNIQQELIQQAFNAQALQGKFKQSQQVRQSDYKPASTVAYPFIQTLYPTPVITTPKSKKLKAHQPPLAIYMANKSQEKARLPDVLNLLKDANTISVLDSIGPNSPKVFIGPSTLRVPNSYSKFELPYLSSIDGSRIQRNVDRLPFFVAPLSYKTPEGFAKIPFPAPHVGSVIVNPLMNEIQDLRPAPITDNIPSSFSFSAFQNNPSTESFHSTISSSIPVKQNTFNYFPSATPNPVISPQSTLSSFQSSFSPFDIFRPLPSSKRPEPVLSTSPRQPLQSYFPTTPSKPTVSYYSFSSPEFTNIPTTNKPSSTSNHQYRGHYITNAAIDTPRNPEKLITTQRDVTSERIQTTPLPPSTSTYRPHNPYSINQAFQPTAAQEEIKSEKVNEVGEYNLDKQPEKQTFDSFNRFVNEQKPVIENTQYSISDNFSPIPYYGPTSSIKPLEYEIKHTSGQINNGVNTDDVVPNQYQFPSNDEQISNIEYQTEIPTTDEVITTTTTTTTSRPVPTTKTPTRRPIHSRGRPRYTTQKPEVSEQVNKPTTRRTPLRERKPSTYRSRFESTKAANADTAVTETSNFESAKRTKISETENAKFNRYSTRSRPVIDDDIKTTTENSLPKTSAAARNQRLRSRGKTQFKLNDNYESSDHLVKKSKKSKEEEKDLAYQRDVLHQNYPVTISERMSTLEVHTSTANPSSSTLDLNTGKIRIYETTGSTQRPYSVQELEQEPTFYDNQPIFQGEPQKFLTHPESVFDVTSEKISSSLMPELYFLSKGSSTEKDRFNSSVNFDTETSTDIMDQIKNVELYDIDKKVENERASEITKQENIYNDEVEKATDLPAFETPIARFRNKLRSRPKHLSSNSPKENLNAEIENKNSNRYSVSQRTEENTESVPNFTRRASIQPVTYRPRLDRHHTRMKIEEIEADLKSSRQQIKSDSRSSTYRYPVYIPESSTTTSTTTENSSDKFDATTKKSHFIRRRPIRPTTSPSNQRTRSTTESSPVVETTTVKRVRVRGRVRSRPTTTEKNDLDNNENISQTSESDAKNNERTVQQKYSSRGRQPTQKYYKRPTSIAEKNSQHLQETGEDQASYDSINRPEYIEYRPTKEKTVSNDYNLENGKAESHWSPKLTYSSFQPIFNPNLIADEIKSDGTEYGTKLPLSNMDDDSEIITARNPYEDVLISVTPSNNPREEKEFSFYESLFPTTTYRIQNENKDEKSSNGMSTFESVLEEVMKNLEQQDEDEYNVDYDRTVRKHEGGEIGEIPPENESNDEYRTTVSSLKNTEIPSYDVSPVVEITRQEKIEPDNTSSTAERKYDMTTERKPRRRGVWRRVKIRPLQKNVLETAESQYYGDTNNELLKEQIINKKDILKSNKFDVKKEIKDKLENLHKEEITTESVEMATNPTTLPEIEFTTESNKNYADEETETSSPEILENSTKKQEKLEKQHAQTQLLSDNEYVTSSFIEYENYEDVTSVPIQTSIKTESLEVTEPNKMDEEIMQNTTKSKDVEEKTEISFTQRSIVTEISKNLPLKLNPTELPEKTTDKFENIINEDITTEINNFEMSVTENIPDTTKITEYDEINEKNRENVKDVLVKSEIAENTTPIASNFWDPMNIINTSMSTEISHETEICYRGRCIKTKKEDHRIVKK